MTKIGQGTFCNLLHHMMVFNVSRLGRRVNFETVGYGGVVDIAKTRHKNVKTPPGHNP